IAMPPADSSPVTTMDEYDRRLLQLINAERISRGLAPAQEWPALRAAALRQSHRMVGLGRIEHAGWDTITSEADAVGCAPASELLVRTWQRPGQAPDPQAALDWYLGSDGHRPYILHPEYRYVASGTVEAGSYVYSTLRWSRDCRWPGPVPSERPSGGTVAPQHDGGRVVVGGRVADRGDDGVEVGGERAGEGEPQPLQAVRQRHPALLDEPVGEDDHPAPGRDVQGAGHRLLRDEPDRQRAGHRRPGRAAVRAQRQRRQVTGPDVLQAAGRRVEHRDEHGGPLPGQRALGEQVESRGRPRRRALVHEQPAQRVAQLAHRRGGGHTVPRDVADDDGEPPVRQREDVVPVATDPPAVPGGVAGLDGPACRLRQRLGQRSALEDLGGAAVGEPAQIERLDGVPAQHGRGLPLLLGPRQAGAAHGLAPALEGLARGETHGVPLPAGDRLVVRVAA